MGRAVTPCPRIIRQIKEVWKLPRTASAEWVRTFTRRFQCLFGWDATVEDVSRACERNDTNTLAKLMPGADAVDPVLLPAVAQLAAGNLPMLPALDPGGGNKRT